MDVVNEVKDLKNFIKELHMPEDLYMNIAPTEIVGEVSLFCFKAKWSWNYLEEILIKCNEMKAVDITQLLQVYNHEGRQPGTGSSLQILTVYTSVA